MNKLKEKLKKNDGFTLVEMLIVVAIIAILVAVSFPMVNGALERSREATDAANERSFKAVLVTSYMNSKFEYADGTKGDFTPGTVYYYDAANGTLTDKAAPKGYGKSTTVMGQDGTDRKDHYLIGKLGTDGIVTMRWVKSGFDLSIADNLIAPNMVSEMS